MKRLIMNRPAKLQLWDEIEDYWLECKDFYNIEENRKRPNVMARNAFMVAVRAVCEGKYTYAAIGKLVGRDHSTVLHAESDHATNIKFDGIYRECYGNFYRNIYSLNRAYEGELLDVTDFLENDKLAAKVQELADEVRRLTRENGKLEQKLETFEENASKEYKFFKAQHHILTTRNTTLNKEVLRLKNLL